MAEFVKIATKSDLPDEGEAKEFTVDEKVVCVANVNGTISAMDNICLHRGGPLGQGIIADGKVICPWHGWEYDPATGQSTTDPAARLNVYPIKVEGDDVLVQL